MSTFPSTTIIAVVVSCFFLLPWSEGDCTANWAHPRVVNCSSTICFCFVPMANELNQTGLQASGMPTRGTKTEEISGRTLSCLSSTKLSNGLSCVALLCGGHDREFEELEWIRNMCLGPSWEMCEHLWGATSPVDQVNYTGKGHPKPLWQCYFLFFSVVSHHCVLWNFIKTGIVPFSARAFESQRSRPGDNCTAYYSAA